MQPPERCTDILYAIFLGETTESAAAEQKTCKVVSFELPKTPREYRRFGNRRWTQMNADPSHWRLSAFICGSFFTVFLGALGVLGG
jgi:hypothetical protein